MGLVIRIILFIALLFLIEFYFTKKTTKTLRTVYPDFSEKKLKLIKTVALSFFNLYPLFVVIVWAYQAIARPDNFLFPQSKIIDYLLIYPFWFFIILVVQCLLLFLLIDILKLLLYPLYKKYKHGFYLTKQGFYLLSWSFLPHTCR